MKLKLTYIFLMLCSCSLYATPIDSLKQLLGQTTQATEQTSLYNKIVREYNRQYHDSTVYFAQKALTLAQTQSNVQVMLTAHLQLADVLRQQGDNTTAVKHVAQVEKQLTQRNFPIIKVHLLLTKGLLAYSNYQDEVALAFFEEGQQLNQQYQAGFCVDFCINLAKVTSPSEAEAHIKEGFECPLDILGKIILQKQLGNLYKDQEQYEKALKLYTSNKQIAQNIKDTLAESNAYQDIGGVYLLEGDWKRAIEFYSRSARLKEKIGDQKGVAHVHHNIAMVYFEQNQHEKSLEYYQKCADYYSNNQDTAELVEIWNNTASVYIAQQKYEEASNLLNQVLVLLPQFPNPTIAIKAQMNLGNIQLKKEQYQEALTLFEVSLEAAQQQEDYFNLVTIHNLLGEVYFHLKDYKTSITYHQAALSLSQELSILYEQNHALFGLYEANKYLGNTTTALDWYEQYTNVKDSLYNVETTTQIAAMQAQYDNLQKEKTIRELSTANQTIALESALKSKQLYLSLLGSALVLCIIALLWWYRHQRQKDLLHQKKMNQLLNEQEIKILAAVVEAQYKEQKRVAREVHDTIGSFLATLMYQHEAGRALAIHTPYYEKYLLVEDLIKQTAKEVRMLASDMTNGKRLNLNLKKVIGELVERIRSIEMFDLEFNGIGNLSELPSNLEFLLYRTAQELLSNILKHAQATKVILQINQLPSEVILMVEDDGQGFDPNIPPKGLGLNNIRERIAPFNGALHIDTHLKKGTTAIVTIPMN